MGLCRRRGRRRGSAMLAWRARARYRQDADLGCAQAEVRHLIRPRLPPGARLAGAGPQGACAITRKDRPVTRHRHPLLCTRHPSQEAPPAGPARHAVGNAAADHPGSGTDTAGSSDWLAERAVKPPGKAGETCAPPGGMPLPAGPRSPATESRRGQR